MSKIDDAISAILRAQDIESVIGSIKSIDRKKTTIDELVINYGWTRIDDSTAILSKYGKDWFMIKPSSTPDIAVITAPSGEGRVRAKVSIYKNIYDEAKKTSEYFNKLIDGDINRNTRIDNLDDKTYEIPEYTEEEITELAQRLFNPLHIPPYEWDVDKRREQDIPYIEKAIADARAAVKSKTIQDHIKLQTFLNLGISAVSYKQESYAIAKRSEVLNYAPPKMIKLMGKNPNLANPQFWIDQANLAVRDRMSIEEIVNYKMPKSLIADTKSGIQKAQKKLDSLTASAKQDTGPKEGWRNLSPEGRENIVKTAKGSKIATAFHVVEASDLIVSHDENGNENPLYPQELQPRDRSRDSSIAWVEKTSKTLDPDSLGKTSRADTGAPIIGPDGVVESGNGRSMAIKQAYKNGMADEYRDWLVEEADYFGLDSGKIKSMRAPVLVRVRTQEVDRAAFAVEANQDDKLSLTATEKARSDAKRLTPDLMALFEPSDSGDLLAPSNQRFIRGFLQSLGNTEAAQYSTSDGKPTASLIDRIQSAVFAKAYKDERLLELMADSAKPEIKNIIVALNAAAPEFIRARDFSESGADSASEALASGIEVSLDEKAINAVIEATNIIRSAKNTGQSVDEFVSQAGLFGDIPPEVAAVAVFISENNRSAKRLGAAFRAMARFVRIELEKGSTVDMFGDPVASMKDVIEAANRELESEFGQGGSISLFESLNGYGDSVFDIFA